MILDSQGKPIRILFAPKDEARLASGYGAVGKGLLPRLAARYGKENILILAPVYQQGGIGEWEGMTVLPGSGPAVSWGEELMGEYWERYKPTFILTVGDWGQFQKLPELAARNAVQWIASVPYDYLDIPDEVVQNTVRYAWKVVPWTQQAKRKFEGHKLPNVTDPIPLGFDPNIWRPLDPWDFPDAMRSVGFAKETFNIFFLQANQRRKYLEEQLQGIALFRKAHPEIPLRIYMHTVAHGEADFGMVLHGLGLHDITRMQEDYTYLTGGFTEEQLCIIMNGADVVMDCAMEGFGYSQLYAQALNLPALCLNEGAGPEVVTYGMAVPSIQVDLSHIPSKPIPSPLHIGQALEEAYKLKGKRSTKARDLAIASYSWDVVANKWFSLIEDTLLVEREKFSMYIPEAPSPMLLERAKHILEVRA